MASDTSLVFNLVARERVSQVLEQVKAKFAKAGSAMGKGLAAGFGVSAGSGVAVAAAGIAAGAASAGIAVKAFSVAAGPQLESVAESWELYEKAQEAAAKGGEEAAEAQKALKEHLAGLPSATRDTANAFIGLKKDFTSWSDELSGTTMPVFTQGIRILRDLLPNLTPFVKAAAGAIGDFLDDVAVGVKSAGFKQWAADMSAAAGPALSNFLTVIKNVGIGFGGLLQAFLPVSSGMTGGLVEMSAAFADWGTKLQNSEGFARFLEMARNGGGALGQLASAGMNLLVALSPLIGTTAMIANGLARVIANTPTPVLTALAGVLLSVRVGMMLYSGITTIIAAKNAIMAASVTRMILVWLRMNAVGVAAMTRTAATAVATAARTAAAWAAAAARATATWLRTIIRIAAVTAARFAMMAARAVVWAATMAAQWLIAMGPVGWVIAIVIGLVVLIIANWSKIKRWTIATWSAITNKISSAINAARAAVSGAVARISSLISSIKSRAISALSGAASWLVSAGRSVVTGLWNGIQSMGGWIRSNLLAWARNAVPGPIARALGIASPSKVTRAQGRWVARGLIDGLTGSAAQVRRASVRLADIVRDSMRPGRRRNRALDVIADDTRRLVALANRQERVATRLKAAQKTLTDLRSARTKLISKVQGSILDAADITRNTGEGWAASISSISARLQEDIGAARSFAANLGTLRKKGLSRDLVAQIAQAGVESGSATAAALASATPAQVKVLNQQQAALRQAATAAGTAAGDAMYASGIRAAQGLVRGLATQNRAIESAMMRIARHMQSAIKRALGIRSPSAVMADEVGRFIPPGIMLGVQQQGRQLASDLQQWAARTVPPAVGAGAQSPQPVRPAAAPLVRGAAGGPLVIHLSIAGRDFGQLWIDTGRREVRARGGTVQAVIGQ